MKNFVIVKKQKSCYDMTHEDFSLIKKIFKSDFKKSFSKIFSNYVFGKEHFEITGNFTYKDKHFYFKVYDCRYFPSSDMLIRTCNQYNNINTNKTKNHFIKIDENMTEEFLRLIEII